VILYELLTGKVAFDGRHSTEVLRATLKERPIPVGELNNLVTAPVARMIDRMIEKNPGHRFQTMDEFIAESEGVLGTLKEEYSPEEQTSVRLALREIFQR
jgi:hypothetical protein